MPDGWEKKIPAFRPADGKNGQMSTRIAAGKTLNSIAALFPHLIGGAADLSPSTETNMKDYSSFSPTDPGGRNFHFGIREHAMGAIINGMALTPGLIPFGSTFLIFSDYMRPPIRLAAIMKIKPILIYTHDSIGLGEDGTTHQPIEQLANLRAIPNITVIRPADANETAQAWKVALQHTGGPVLLVLTRQNIPIIDPDSYKRTGDLSKGGLYPLRTGPLTRTDPDRHRLGGKPNPAGAAEAQRERHRGPRRKHALLGTVRPAG